MDVRMRDIKLKLENKNKSYGLVLSDIETLEEWTRELFRKSSSRVSLISDKKYLQISGIHVLVVSQLEYLLKSLELIKRPFEIKEIVKNSNALSQLEKDRLMYLIFTRHTIAHNGGHPDKEFINNIKKEIIKLNVPLPKNNTLTPISPEDMVKIYIKLIRKIILLDIAKDILSSEEIKVVEESLKWKKLYLYP